MNSTKILFAVVVALLVNIFWFNMQTKDCLNQIQTQLNDTKVIIKEIKIPVSLPDSTRYFSRPEIHGKTRKTRQPVQGATGR